MRNSPKFPLTSSCVQLYKSPLNIIKSYCKSPFYPMYWGVKLSSFKSHCITLITPFFPNNHYIKLHENLLRIHNWLVVWNMVFHSVGKSPHPLKCILRGGGGSREFSYISRAPPTSETGIFVWTSFCKIKRLPKEVGSVPHTFSVFGFKSLFRKRWGGGFIHWFCKAMDLWCSWSFPGESYEIAWRFWPPPPLKSKFAKLWEATYPPWVNTLIIPMFGGGGGCEIWKGGGGGGAQMKYHECMHLGGQQQFHAAHSLYMKVVLRSLNVLNAIVCSGCFWFLSIVRVPFSNIFSGLHCTERMFF